MHDLATLPPDQSRRAGVAATIGCALEWYDFLTYAFFAIQIGNTFFPSLSPYLSLMASLATFGVGFLARPVGAYVLGHYGDRHGRRPAMLISMVLMGLGILLLVITPGYATIGWAAPIIAVIARLIQGFAVGGEVGASSVYMVEAAPPHLRGLGASMQGIAQGVGNVAGTLVGLALSLWLSAELMSDYGWRIAMALGIVVIPYALYIRRNLPETRRDEEQAGDTQGGSYPSLTKLVLTVSALIAGGTMSTYTISYVATFGQAQLGFSVTQAMLVQLGANIAFVMGALAGGLFSDRFGRKAGAISCSVLLVTLAVPGFMLITGSRSMPVLVLCSVLFSFVAQFRGSSVYAALAEGAHPAIRTRVFGLVYALPVTIFGSVTQLALTWLIKTAGTPVAAGWFLAGANVVALVGALFLPETSARYRKPPAAQLLPA